MMISLQASYFAFLPARKNMPRKQKAKWQPNRLIWVWGTQNSFMLFTPCLLIMQNSTDKKTEVAFLFC